MVVFLIKNSCENPTFLNIFWVYCLIIRLKKLKRLAGMTVWKNTYHSSLIQTPETYPDLVNQLLSWSFCLPWHHSIAWLANNKSANHYLSCPGPSLRQYRPPPGALQPNYSLWRTTASGLHCSCWLQKHTTARVGRKEGRKVYNRVNEQVRHSSTNTALSVYRNKDKTIHLCQV